MTIHAHWGLGFDPEMGSRVFINPKRYLMETRRIDWLDILCVVPFQWYCFLTEVQDGGRRRVEFNRK